MTAAAVTIPIRPDNAPTAAAPKKHPSVSEKKLEKRLVRLAAKAITDYGMITEGDRVLVAMSGGKDSYVLLEVLQKLQQRAPIHFELLACHVSQHIPNEPTQMIEDYLRNCGSPWHIEDQDTHSIIERLIPSGKNVCSLCARLRRGILYRVAREKGCTKIALGHQMDDVVSPLLLNMFYSGRIKAMPPVLRSDNGRNIVIRPLIYVREYENAKWARLRGYPLVPKNLCEGGENHQRQEIKKLLAQWDRQYDSRIFNLFMSTTRIAPSQLADPALFDFAGLRANPNAGSGSEDAEEDEVADCLS